MTDALARVGLWGLGAHAQRNIIPALRRAQSVELVALHTRSVEVLEMTADAEGVRAHSNAEALLADPLVDVVYLATPTGLHASMGEAVIDAGKHLWCEKPMTTTHQKTSDLVAKATASSLVALEADMFVHHPQFLRLVELVEASAVGSVVSMTARFGFPHRGLDDFRYSVELGGGALLDAGFYPVAAAVGLLGASLQIAGSTMTSQLSTDVDTGGTALATSGERGAMLDWGFGRSYRSEIEIWCEDGVIRAKRAFSKPSDLDTEVVLQHQSGETTTLPIPAADHFALMLDSFADVTRGVVPYDPIPVLGRARLLTQIRNASSGRSGQ